eukprot:m51a1_g11220 hypothetical protein (1167) ;mRNA; f:33014-36895
MRTALTVLLLPVLLLVGTLSSLAGLCAAGAVWPDVHYSTGPLPEGLHVVASDVSDDDGHCVPVVAGTALCTGDFDGDSQADVVLGATCCVTWLLFGPLNASAVVDAVAGVRNGASAVALRACGHTSAGDVNGDGIDDLAVGGAVLLGRRSRTAWPQAADNGIAQSDGFAVVGSAGPASLTILGDVNGDGRADLSVGNHVIFGSATPSSPVDISAAHLDGFQVASASALRGVGDVNGDGLADVVADVGSGGRPLLVLGRRSFPRVVGATSSGVVTMVGDARDDDDGAAVAGVGDVNGDSVGDLLVLSTRWWPSRRMVAHLLFGSAAKWGPAVDLAASGVALHGAEHDGRDAVSGSALGDINGDGVGDLVICQSHQCFVVYGKRGTWPRSIELAEWNGPRQGFRVRGGCGGASAGSTFVPAGGDINGDSVSDFVVAHAVDGGPGACNVLFGGLQRSGVVDVDRETQSGSGIALLSAQQSKGLGQSVSCAGDFDGDAIDDFLVGSPGGRNPGHGGGAYLVHGAPEELSANPVGSSMRFWCSSTGAHCGSSVAGGGDVNGDGLADAVVTTDSGLGGVYVVYGSRGWRGSNASLELESLNQSAGCFIAGEAGGWANTSISAAGDFNGDALGDVVVGVPSIGKAYVVLGRSGGLQPGLALSQLSGADGVRVTARECTGCLLGTSVASVDINDDDLADIAIGTPGSGAGAGSLFVLFGTRERISGGDLDVSALDGTNGIVIRGESAGDRVGLSVSSAGDFNGDSVGDLVVGGMRADGSAGKAYVIFGRRGRWPAVVDLGGLSATGAGFRLDPPEAHRSAGAVVSGAGDFNRDGVDDVAVGAPRSGAVLVLFGRRRTWPATLSWRDTPDAGFVVTMPEWSRLGVAISSTSCYAAARAPTLLLGAPNQSGVGRGAVFVIKGGYEPQAGESITSAAGCCRGKVDVPFSFRLPQTALTQPGGESLSVLIEPAWLRYDPATRTVSSDMRFSPAGAVRVRATARNSRGVTVTQQWSIVVEQTLSIHSADQGCRCTVGEDCHLPAITVKSPRTDGYFSAEVVFNEAVEHAVGWPLTEGTSLMVRSERPGDIEEALRHAVFLPASTALRRIMVTVWDSRNQSASTSIQVETVAQSIVVFVCCAVAAVVAFVVAIFSASVAAIRSLGRESEYHQLAQPHSVN